MLRAVMFLIVVLVLAASPTAAKIDARLASLERVALVAGDPPTDDQLVVACLKNRLPDALPVKLVERDSADAVLVITSNFPSKGARVLMGSMGATPSAKIRVEMDGRTVWSDGAKNRMGTGEIGRASCRERVKR